MKTLRRKVKILRCKIKDGYYDVKQLIRNLPHFLKQAWQWRSWDAEYSIIAFAENLELQGKMIKKYYSWNNAHKTYVRCMTAAHLLRQAYDTDYKYKDKSYINWSNNNKIEFIRIIDGRFKGCSQLGYIRKYPEAYSVKMQNVIDKRINNVILNRKKEAWEYIHKWIEYMWD